jgi:hypothetical protein
MFDFKKISKVTKFEICFKARLRYSPLNLGPFLKNIHSVGRGFGKPKRFVKSKHAYLETIIATFEFFIKSSGVPNAFLKK